MKQYNELESESKSEYNYEYKQLYECGYYKQCERDYPNESKFMFMNVNMNSLVYMLMNLKIRKGNMRGSLLMCAASYKRIVCNNINMDMIKNVNVNTAIL